jgi:hypothetical protein
LRPLAAGIGAVEQRAEAVPVSVQHAGKDGGQLDRLAALAGLVRAEILRRAQVEQEPGGHLAFLEEFLHVRHLQPCGDIPVDMAHVVVILVFAQVGQIDAETAKQRVIVAVQQAIEPAQHGHFKAAQRGLRRWRQRGHGFQAPFPEEGTASGCAGSAGRR